MLIAGGRRGRGRRLLNIHVAESISLIRVTIDIDVILESGQTRVDSEPNYHFHVRHILPSKQV